MLSERLLTGVMRRAVGRYMVLAPYDAPSLPRPADGGSYMLYVHVPFCERLCPYCSFNRFPFESEMATRYFRVLREEMRMTAALGYDFESMYVGGGTPTVMVDELCATIDLARELFDIKEVSSETNPNHLHPEVIDKLTERVQRFSVGVQSFDDALLTQMDRLDKYGDGAETLERLRAIEGRFHSLNVDMIFNFPGQTLGTLERDIETLKTSGCNQTTFYPLMASPAVARSLADTVGRVDYDREHTFYEVVAEGLKDTFEPASAWTFSRTAGRMIDEYIVDYEDYVGIGSGAFSYLGGKLYCNTFSLGEYEGRLNAGEMSVVSRRVFAPRQRMRYRFMMSLFGLKLDKRAFERDFGVPVERGLPRETAFMRLAGAYATDTDEEITLTLKGRYLLVAMMRGFFVGVNHLRDQARAALPAEERDLLFGEGKACEAERAAAPMV